MEVVLRPARPTDAPQVADILIAAHAQMRPYPRDVHTDEEIRARIGDVVLPGNEIVIAEAGAALRVIDQQRLTLAKAKAEAEAELREREQDVSHGGFL
jgi:hypothetical protein